MKCDCFFKSVIQDHGRKNNQYINKISLTLKLAASHKALSCT